MAMWRAYYARLCSERQKKVSFNSFTILQEDGAVTSPTLQVRELREPRGVWWWGGPSAWGYTRSQTSKLLGVL